MTAAPVVQDKPDIKTSQEMVLFNKPAPSAQPAPSTAMVLAKPPENKPAQPNALVLATQPATATAATTPSLPTLPNNVWDSSLALNAMIHCDCFPCCYCCCCCCSVTMVSVCYKQCYWWCSETRWRSVGRLEVNDRMVNEPMGTRPRTIEFS